MTEIVRAAFLRHGLLHMKSEAPTNCRPPQLLGGNWSMSCPHRAVLDPLNLPAPISYLMPNNLADTVTGPMLWHDWDFSLRVRVKHTQALLFFGSINICLWDSLSSWLPISPVFKTRGWVQKEWQWLPSAPVPLPLGGSSVSGWTCGHLWLPCGRCCQGLIVCKPWQNVRSRVGNRK